MATRQEQNRKILALDDWPNQLVVLKAMFNTNDLVVKYLDDENEEVTISNQNEFDFAHQIAISSTNSILRLILRNSRNEIISKLELTIETGTVKGENKEREISATSDSQFVQSQLDSLKTSIEKSMPKSITSSFASLSSKSSTETATTSANEFTPNQVQWLDNYLSNFRRDLLSEIDSVYSKKSSSHIMSTSSFNDLIDFDFGLKSTSDDELESKVKKMFDKIIEARFSKRTLKTAYLEEELSSTGAFMAEFVKDFNMPDGTKCDPNMKFKKTWLVRNVGKLAWRESGFPVKLIWIAGNMNTNGNVDYVNVPDTDVNETVSISVELVAPAEQGVYFSEWVLSCNGFNFGPRIWCTIEVIANSVAQSEQPIKDDPVCSLNTLTHSENPFRHEAIDEVSYNKINEYLKSRMSKQHSLGAPGEDMDDEFVVIPDCFDLGKKWQRPQSSKSANNDDLIMLGSDLVKSQAADSSIIDNKNQSLESSIEPINSEHFGDNESDLNRTEDEFDPIRSTDKLTLTAESESEVTSQTTQSEILPTTSVTTNSQSNTNQTSTHLNLSSALDKMKQALSNLGGPSYLGSIDTSMEVESQPRQTFDESMKKLISMGFANRNQNAKLLLQYNNNIEKVVQAIIDIHDNNWSEHR